MGTLEETWVAEYDAYAACCLEAKGADVAAVVVVVVLPVPVEVARRPSSTDLLLFATICPAFPQLLAALLLPPPAAAAAAALLL